MNNLKNTHMEKKTLTNEEILGLNNGLLGTVPRFGMGVPMIGAMQYFDQSEDGDITLKFMKAMDKVEIVVKAHEKLGKEEIKGETQQERQVRFEKFGEKDSGISFSDDEKIYFEDLENLMHPTDSKTKRSPLLIRNLKPILIFDKKEKGKKE